MNISKKIFLTVLILIFITSCAGKKGLEKHDVVTIHKPASVLVVPFIKITNDNIDKVNCKVKDKLINCTYKDDKFKLIGLQLADKFYFSLQNRTDYKPISISSVESVFNQNIEKINISDIVEKFKIDYIIEGYIYKFKERQGSEYSVKEAATVHFVVVLRNPITGESLWSKEYYEQQEELSNNLLNVFNFFKRKGKWLTALELSEQAIEKIVNELP